MAVNPISMENKFNHLTKTPDGTRQTLHDADVFRRPTRNDLGLILEEAADALKKRIDGVGLSNDIIDNNIKALRDIVNDMKGQNEIENMGYQWEVIAIFGSCIGTVLEALERKI